MKTVDIPNTEPATGPTIHECDNGGLEFDGVMDGIIDGEVVFMAVWLRAAAEAAAE